MIRFIPYEPTSPYCPECGEFTNSTLEFVEDENGEEVLACPFCGYEEEEEEE